MTDRPPPPNLRESKDPDKECGCCRMDDHGCCWGYGNLPVEDDWVCDSWAKGPRVDEDEDEPATPREDQPRKMRDASVEVREVFRAKRSRK